MGSAQTHRGLRLAALTSLLVAIGAPAIAHAAEIEFYATTDRDELGVDDTLTLTVTVGTDASSGGDSSEELRLPDAPDFEVLSRSQSQQMSFVMGHGGPPSFRKVRSYTMLLQPRRTGTFTIQPGKLLFRGHAYETGALRIKVVSGTRGSGRPSRNPPPSANTPPAPPANPFGNLGGLLGGGSDDPDAQDLLNEFFGNAHPSNDSDLYLRAFLDKKQAFLGEQVTFSIYLFSRVDISGVDGFKMPKLDGFWAEDLETPSQISGELKMIDGVPYRVFLLRKRALFPLKAGKLTIDPVEVEVSTGFSLIIDGGRKVKRVTQSQFVEVLPLPTGAPAGFETPNVGQWRLGADAVPTTVQLGLPVTLKVKLEGKGNLHDVVSPKLPQVSGCKIYDPNITEKTSTANARFGGSRLLEFLIMPEQSGTFEIPPLTLQYFDPIKKSYESSTTQAIQIHVEAGAGGATQPGKNPTASTGSGPSHQNVLDLGALRPLRFKGDLSRPAPPVYRRPYFLPAALAPVLLWLGLLAVGLVRSTLAPSADGIQRGLAGKARRRLRTARALLKAKKPDEFYAEVSRALNDYLAARLGVPVVGLTRPDLTAKLAGLAPELFARLCAVFDTCDAGRFAPGGSTTASMGRLLDETTAVMAALEGAKLSGAQP